MTFEDQLLRAVSAVAVGAKLPVSRIARDLNCSASVVIDGLTKLVESGAIDRATMRVPDKAVAKIGPVPALVAPPLLAEVEAFLELSGMAPTTFGKKAGVGMSFVANLRAGQQSRAPTEARVRSFFARWVAEQEIGTKLPGTGDARKPGNAASVPGADDDAGVAVARCSPVTPAERPDRTAPIAAGRPTAATLDLPETLAHHPRARLMPGLSPELWADIRALAADPEDRPAAILPGLIERGIEVMRAEASGAAS